MIDSPKIVKAFKDCADYIEQNPSKYYWYESDKCNFGLFIKFLYPNEDYYKIGVGVWSVSQRLFESIYQKFHEDYQITLNNIKEIEQLDPIKFKREIIIDWQDFKNPKKVVEEFKKRANEMEIRLNEK